jgi:hypothetical protein
MTVMLRTTPTSHRSAKVQQTNTIPTIEEQRFNKQAQHQPSMRMFNKQTNTIRQARQNK